MAIPSYNGARKQPNLVPLLTLLLAREGVPVLVHGVTEDPGRVTSAEIFTHLQIPHARSPYGQLPPGPSPLSLPLLLVVSTAQVGPSGPSALDSHSLVRQFE